MDPGLGKPDLPQPPVQGHNYLCSEAEAGKFEVQCQTMLRDIGSNADTSGDSTALRVADARLHSPWASHVLPKTQSGQCGTKKHKKSIPNS